MAVYEASPNENSHFEQLPPEAWVVRRCEQLYEEMKECRKIRGRFHQYFIHGQIADCSQWSSDYKNCMKWRKNADMNALMAVVQSENARRLQRLAGHEANDVWQRRRSPPDNWNGPLPETLRRKQQQSTLYADSCNNKSA